MYFSFNLYSTTLLIFFVHGILLAFLIYWDGNRTTNRSSWWLSLLLTLLCLYIAPFMFGYAGWYAKDGYRETLFYLPLQQLLFIGPVAYGYVKRALNPERTPQKREWIHWLPGTLYLGYSTVIFVVDVLILKEASFYADGQDKDLDLWYQLAGFVSMTIYFSLSLQVYHIYRLRIFDRLSFAEEVVFQWIRRFLLLLLLVLFLRLLFFLLNPEWGEFGRKFWYYGCIAFATYYLGLAGYRHTLRLGMYTTQDERSPLWTALKDPLPESQAEKAKANLTSEETDAWMARIASLMKGKRLYENPLLTLSDLAGELGTTTRNVSLAINQGARLNFNDYVNGFRVEAVIAHLQHQQSADLTLLGIALSCGFNSKSTFNRAFKKHTGATPKEYLNLQEK